MEAAAKKESILTHSLSSSLIRWCGSGCVERTAGLFTLSSLQNFLFSVSSIVILCSLLQLSGGNHTHQLVQIPEEKLPKLKYLILFVLPPPLFFYPSSTFLSCPFNSCHCFIVSFLCCSVLNMLAPMCAIIDFSSTPLPSFFLTHRIHGAFLEPFIHVTVRILQPFLPTLASAPILLSM